ncbi:MAG TPA: DUF6298 domain-containing protein [Opitutaceae bacterium]|nr:DUF6298 domain-containing protein [Opitutaceae bacterium]
MNSLRSLFPRRILCGGAVALLGAVTVWGAQVKVPFVRLRNGGLSYTADTRGNRVPDFSSAGYHGGGVPLPRVPARVRVTPPSGDAAPVIQAAIDYVSGLAPDAHGFRGAVLLARGRYEIHGYLTIAASGVVLRGAGPGTDGTVLVATGTGRRTLIQVHGNGASVRSGGALRITDPYVPVGATRFVLDQTDGLRPGDRILIERPSTKAWIAAIGMNDAPAREPFEWQAGKMNLACERTIVAIDGNRVDVDVPLTTALDQQFGGGTVTRVTWPGRVTESGVENLRCESAFDASNPKDEQHAWMAVSLDTVENAWVDHVTAVHFASSAVQIGAGARAVTVQDCACVAPVSEIGGYRRNSFHTSGQQTLFVRCTAEHGIHDFTTGYLTSGPNVFYDCRAHEALGWSGSIGSWASGILFDNVHIDGGGLNLDNLETWNQGVGWAAANSVLWQCSASTMAVRSPPTAHNWAIGVWAEFLGDGPWDQVNEFVRPESLYVAQLTARRGRAAADALAPRVFPSEPREIPSLAQAVPELAARLAPKPVPAGHPLRLTNGWLVSGGALLVGRPAPELEWWRGMVLPTRAPEFGASITRFVPGQTGRGFTDDLGAVTDTMVRDGEVVVRHHYGLWYDRRRMSHERVRRDTPDDWPPFFEQPFARSGQGEAWDRMSRYDLTRYNPWYFNRLHQFAELSRQKGLVLISEMYFQHNILEAGAHWVDCPWRPANCLQATGFPEPPPFTDSEGNAPSTPDLGKRIFMAAQFYDVSNPLRRSLHRAFIRHYLDTLSDEPNVIHTMTAENSGPLAFDQFWFDVVAEWERETGRHPLIALSAPKDVQDAILADPKRAATVDVIDLTYWWRTEKGKLFAPPGGTRETPRQWEREWHGGRASAASLADMVHEYRRRFPAKAVITGLEQGDGWDFVAAGGSLPKLPGTTDPALRATLARMQPTSDVRLENAPGWVLGAPDVGYFVCSTGDRAIGLRLPTGAATYRAVCIDPSTGRADPRVPAEAISGAGTAILSKVAGHQALWWLVPRQHD